MAGIVTVRYQEPPRLIVQDCQVMQGDIFADVSLLEPTPQGGVETRRGPGILLTPTCDFALKPENQVRQMAPIEVLKEGDPRPGRWQQAEWPLHLLPLPPLSTLWPHGGIINFRGVVPIHAHSLDLAPRIATLDAVGLRTLLAAHITYYTRSGVDPNAMPIAPDDPRRLWEALDAAVAIPSLAGRRDALDGVIEVATKALTRHHGFSGPSTAARLVQLETIASTDALPESSRTAVTALVDAASTIQPLFAIVPAEMEQHRSELDRIAGDIERIGRVLQEKAPVQVTREVLKRVGLSNLIRE